VGAILLFLAGRALLAPLGIPGVGVAQWLFLALPIAVAIRAGRFDPVVTLGLRPVSGRVLAGAGLLMFGALGMNSVVAWLQSRWVEVPVELVEALNQALRPSGPLELVMILTAVAVTPAVCEELAFRGVMLSSWHRWPAPIAIGLNGLLFGAIHWLPGGAFRVLPAAVSGMFIAWAVWRTRSLWVGMWMHLLNNGFLVLAAMAIGAMEEATAIQGVNPAGTQPPNLFAVGLFAVLLVTGIRIVGSAPNPSTGGGEPAVEESA
jgi:sodium transport system permease protein